MNTRTVLLEALAVADAGGVLASPGALLVRVVPLPLDPGRRQRLDLLAAGTPNEVRGHALASGAQVVVRPGAVLIPGMVNAHIHLDLTQIGPKLHDPTKGFLSWVNMVRANRLNMQASITTSVHRGVELSFAGGVVAVGDIAGAVGGKLCPWAAEALMTSRMSGVSFLEFFAIGNYQQPALEAVQAVALDVARSSAEGDCVRLGFQPHAPYSVSTDAYEGIAAFAKAYGIRLATHLAETPEERQFVRTASGPLVDLLKQVGAWDDSLDDAFDNPGMSPVRFLEPALRLTRFAAAHVNDADDDDIRMLASTKTSVVFCPRASAYFGAEKHFGPHRYRDMLAAGVNVALGTDSIINLPESAADPKAGGMSVLDEMRLLYRRDAADPTTLLAMATVNGARALGLHPQAFGFKSPIGSAIGGVVAVEVSARDADPLQRVMSSTAPPELLLVGAA